MASLLESTIEQQNSLAKMDEIRQRVHARRRQQQSRQTQQKTRKKERKTSVLSSLDFWESDSSLKTAIDGAAAVAEAQDVIDGSSRSNSRGNSNSHTHSNNGRPPARRKGTTKKVRCKSTRASWSPDVRHSASRSSQQQQQQQQPTMLGLASPDECNDADSSSQHGMIHSAPLAPPSDNQTQRKLPGRYSRRGSVIKTARTTDDISLQPRARLSMASTASTASDDCTVSSIDTSGSNHSRHSTHSNHSTHSAPAAPRRSRGSRSQRRGSMVGSMSTDMVTPGAKKPTDNAPSQPPTSSSMHKRMSSRQRPPRALSRASPAAAAEAAASDVPPPPPPLCIDQAPIGSLLPSPELRRRRPNRRTDGSKCAIRSSSCHATVSRPSTSSVSSSTPSASKAPASQDLRSPQPSKATTSRSKPKSRFSLSKLSSLPTVSPTPGCSGGRADSFRSQRPSCPSYASPSKQGQLRPGTDDGTVSTAEMSITDTSMISGDSLSSACSSGEHLVVSPVTNGNSDTDTANTKKPRASRSTEMPSLSAHGRLQEHSKCSKSTRSSRTQRKSSRKKRNANRSVRFGFAMVQEYPIMLGDNPSVTAGAPLTIGWVPISSYDINVDLHQHMKKNKKKQGKDSHKKSSSKRKSQDSPSADINTAPVAEAPSNSATTTAATAVVPVNGSTTGLPKSTKRHRHNARKEMYLSEHVRAQILLRAGYCLADIVDAGLEVQRIQKERAESLRKQQWEIVRDVFSKAGNAFSRILSVDSHLQNILYPNRINTPSSPTPTSMCPQMA